jgi:DNA-binding NarL/FixJ family response regulator
MNRQIHIGIAEDHDLVRDGLVSLLKEYKRIKVVFEVSNGQELLEKLKTTKPDIILLDIEMPVMTGKEALDKIKQSHPKLKIIVVSAFFQESHVIEYIKKGVNSFLPKDCKIDTLVEAVYAVQEQGTYFDNKISMMLAKEVTAPTNLKKTREDTLSAQEINIIKLICQHKTSKEIADHFSLSKKTIEFHRSKIMRKTHSENVAALVIYAIQNKLVNL